MRSLSLARAMESKFAAKAKSAWSADEDGKGVGGADRSARRSRQESINEVGVRVSRIPHHGSLLISGLSYKTAFSNELLTSIFPL
jgi:hypothetical protein